MFLDLNWKYSLLIFTFYLASNTSQAQIMTKPSQEEINSLDWWAQLMYSDTASAFSVDQAYEAHFHDNPFVKSYHTQFYKRWRRAVDPYLNGQGYYQLPTVAEQLLKRQESMSRQSSGAKAGGWTLLGPIKTYNTNGEVVSVQANVYSIDRSLSNPTILFCGTEPGEIYKSTDGANSWFNVSLDDPLSGGVNSIKINSQNPDVVFAGSGGNLFRTIDGGLTWNVVLSSLGSVREINIIPTSPNIVFAATNNGLFRSDDSGDNWTELFSETTHDVKFNSGNDNIVYIVKNNPVEDVCEFYLSTDAGLSFTQITNGWYSSTQTGRHDGGARIAVSDADPNRVYAYLIGEAKTGDTGFIGVYRSNDGGYTWSLPNGPAGGPYDAVHQNLAIGSPSWQYHQGYYNCALAASNSNPNEILVGGLNLYKSDDGGATFYPLAGYVGGSYSMHVDMQDFRTYGSTTFITTDGGIYQSDDFFNTANFTSNMNGIHSSDYWGFGQGWNEDVTIGGLYHNGNMTSYENWATDDFLQLGGGEPASGYVNPGLNRHVYSSDINGRILPLNIGDPVQSIGFGIDPNESYWTVNSTELEFDPRCYTRLFTGLDNQLWYSDDAGVTFELMHEFGSVAADKVTYIELAWTDPNVIYVCQQSGSNDAILWKTDDYGMSWVQVSIPIVGNEKKMLIQVDPEDENHIWLAYASGPNGQKIFESQDGGSNWTNRTTSTLNNQSIRWISFVGGSDNGVYIATNETVFYKNQSLSDWEYFGDGLPVVAPSNIARPFYRDGKIRLATYGKGIWESTMYEVQEGPVAQISVDKMSSVYHCVADTFHFVDHSMLNHNNATWEWSFQGGSPATSQNWEEYVVFPGPGDYEVTLEVTDEYGNSDADTLMISITPFTPSVVINEDFEGSFPPNNWWVDNADLGQTWELSGDAGGYGLSNNSMVMRGFDYWPGGDEDDISFSYDMSTIDSAILTFDVAYARYAVNYSDSIEILVSTDCGASYTSLYYKGGSDLATAPDNNQFYIPAANEWRTDTINLQAYFGVSDLIVAFRSHTGWGNNVYVDNINLTGNNVANTDEKLLTDVNIYPNIFNPGKLLYLSAPNDQVVDLYLYTSDGKLIRQLSISGGTHFDPELCDSGLYYYMVRSATKIKKGKLIVVNR